MIDKDKYDPFHELTTAEAAAEAKNDRRTIVAWIRRGDLPATRRPGLRGHYRIRWCDLYEALHKPARPSQSP